MAIRSGIGIGGAQVIDTRDIMSASARQIAQQQKAQALQAEKEAKASEKFNEDLADIMASYKTTGARDIDIPEITAAYNQIKEYHSQSNKVKEAERPLFKATVKNMMNTVNDTSLRSKELEGRTYTTASRIAQNPWDYDSKVIQDLDYVKKTPISKLGALANLDPSTYERLPNFGTIDKIMADVYEIGKNKADFIEQITEKGQRFNVSRVDPAVIQDNLVLGLRSSPEAMKAVNYRFSKQFGKQPTEQDLTNFMMDDYKTKYNLEYTSAPKDLERPRAAAKLTNDDIFAGWIKGAFTKDNAESVKNLRSASGQKIKIIDKPDGTFVVEYKPMIDVGKGGVPILIESPEPKTEIATNPGELAGILTDAGVKGTNAKLISKVGGSYRSPTTAKAPASNTAKKELTWAEKQAKAAASKK